MNWLLIAIIVLALIIILKVATFRHKLTITIIILLVLFFYISFGVVARNQALNFKTASGILEAGKLYFSWVGNAFTNVKALTGSAVDMDWTEDGKNLTDYDPRNIMKG